jgi:hypothetical protein
LVKPVNCTRKREESRKNGLHPVVPVVRRSEDGILAQAFAVFRRELPKLAGMVAGQ